MNEYTSIGDMMAEMAEVLRPPERLTVSSAAEKYRFINNPGAYVGPWKNETTPYMIEPADLMTDRAVNAIVFVGVAQMGKTDGLIINPILYSAICDPMDTLVYQTSQTMARDFSIRRIDRLIRHSPEMRRRLLPGNNDNVFDKKMSNGMLLTLSWPTINELSGRPVGRALLTDYDRMPQDVDGEGSPFDLARKRTTTFGSAAKTLAESSPGYEVEDTSWVRQSPHQAPPCKGILALYNRGDRRRWYWQCPHCSDWFEPCFELLRWPESTDVMECAEKAQLMCPRCAVLIPPSMKFELNVKGRWVRDGQTLLKDGSLVGTAVRSDIASFWLKGPAAAFAPWSSLVSRYLLAEQEFQRTGSQEALKSTVNTDQGDPYTPRGLDRMRTPDELKTRSVETPDHEVPDDVRFLVATADVQKSKFVVQVFGVGPGASDEPYRLTVVDRFDLVKSKRIDEDGERWPVRPAKYLEDWDLLTEQVLDKAYPMADGSGHMRVSRVAVDSGGKEGVTSNAYDFWRSLRKNGAGEHLRVHLVKGEALPNSPRVRTSYPDAARKDRKAQARGDVPVLFFQTNLIKDELNNRLERALDDGAAFTWPAWLPDAWFTEMCSEVRTAKGWENPRKARNEAWDLAVYAIGLCLILKVDRLNWDEPVLDYARDRQKNPYFTPTPKDGESTVALSQPGRYGLGKFAELLAS